MHPTPFQLRWKHIKQILPTTVETTISLSDRAYVQFMPPNKNPESIPVYTVPTPTRVHLRYKTWYSARKEVKSQWAGGSTNRLAFVSLCVNFDDDDAVLVEMRQTCEPRGPLGMCRKLQLPQQIRPCEKAHNPELALREIRNHRKQKQNNRISHASSCHVYRKCA